MSDLTCVDASHNKPFRKYCPDCIREKNRRIEELESEVKHLWSVRSQNVEQAQRIEELEEFITAVMPEGRYEIWIPPAKGEQ